MMPECARGFRVRVDLMYAKPPVWRRLDLPGDLMLDELQVVLQVAMGWEDSHLHKFGVGADRRTRAYFITGFDLAKAMKASPKTRYGSTRCLPRVTGSLTRHRLRSV
jgi:hypothetical protein